MRLISIISIFVLTQIFFTSCDNELDLTADYKDITIAYGLLNPNDSIHYLKITKAFLGDGNALEYAQNPDSSSYGKDIEVKVIEMDGSTVIREIEFDTTTVYNKDPGDSVFYFPEQLVYCTNKDEDIYLNRNYTYHLHIENINSGKIVSAETELIGDFSIRTPQEEINLTIENEPDKNETVRWDVAENSKKHKLVIQFIYKEFNINNEEETKTISWDSFQELDSDDAQSGQLQIVYPSTSFYEFLLNTVPYSDVNNENDIAHRVAKGFRFYIFNSDNTLNTYMNLNRPSGTILQEIPNYTNINNGIGIFASRTYVTQNNGISPNTEGFLVDIEELKFIPDPE